MGGTEQHNCFDKTRPQWHRMLHLIAPDMQTHTFDDTGQLELYSNYTLLSSV